MPYVEHRSPPGVPVTSSQTTIATGKAPTALNEVRRASRGWGCNLIADANATTIREIQQALCSETNSLIKRRQAFTPQELWVSHRSTTTGCSRSSQKPSDYMDTGMHRSRYLCGSKIGTAGCGYPRERLLEFYMSEILELRWQHHSQWANEP